MLSPFYTLGDFAALLLRYRCHYRKSKLAVAVTGVYIIVYKDNTYALRPKHTGDVKGVYSVSGKAADLFCKDDIYTAGHGKGDHFVEAVTVERCRAACTLVIEHSNQSHGVRISDIIIKERPL